MPVPYDPGSGVSPRGTLLAVSRARDLDLPEPRGGVLTSGFKCLSADGHLVVVPARSRGAALAGIALHAPRAPEAIAARLTAWRVVRFLGPRALPGRASPWAPPTGMDDWNRLVARWSGVTGEIEAFAAVVGTGEGAPFEVVLLRGDRPIAHVRVRRGLSESFAREVEVARRMSSAHPRSFAVPYVLARAEVGSWAYLLTRPFRPRVRPAEAPPLARVAAEVSVGLAGLPKSEPVPNHWQPMHGQIAPWTLRETEDDGWVLTDWEGARWGPPGADEVFYRAAAAVLTGEDPGPIHVREALDYWKRRFEEGDVPSEPGDVFVARMARALRVMRGLEPWA